MRIRPTAVLILALSVVSAATFAHHGTANYNTDTQVSVKGTVTDFQFNNPHVLIFMQVKDESGKTTDWQGELTSPNHLIRAGWNAHSLKPGDKITITGWRSASGANSMWITKTVVNGRELTTAAGD